MNFKTLSFAVAMFAVGVFGLNGLDQSAKTQEAQAAVQEMVLGNPESTVTVTEYASFTCPHCANFHNGPFKQLKADYIDTGKIKFVFREVYFDRFGLWASIVARCGGEEKFYGVSDLLFAQMREWASGGPQEIAGKLRTIGLTAGLTEGQLDACFTDGDKAQALVEWYEQNAKADGIRSTPSFVINGKLYSNMSYEDFKGVLDGLLDS
ncbi:MAG: DsbA family protein [Planktomarina sp.]